MAQSTLKSPAWISVILAAAVGVAAGVVVLRGGTAPPATIAADKGTADAAAGTHIDTGIPADPAHDHSLCYAAYEAKKYDEAQRACSVAIAHNPGDMRVRYWRGVAYRETGKDDLALPDLTAVANSGDSVRDYAAIELSMAYFDRNDIDGALGVLNKYTYLYDKYVDGGANMAVAYNNRCYAYMQLGELQKALDDCRQSLKHGNLSDARRKEQLLVKRLGEHDAAR